MRHTLRLLTSVSLAATVFLSADAQNTGINVTGATPNIKALLDIDVAGLPAAAKKGMLIPRMTYAQRLAIPVDNLTNADQGLWVYQTDDGTSADPTQAAALAHGFWYFEYWGSGSPQNQWVRWTAGNASWKLTGNANTAFASNYLGSSTGTNDDLYIRTSNNTALNPSIRIDGSILPNAGFVGVNLAAPAVERLEVNGGVRVGNTALNTVGAIRFDAAAVSPNRWHVGNIDNTAAGWRRLENAETLHLNQSYCPIQDQCLNVNGIKIRGVYDNTPVAGNASTPFATATGSNQRNGHRVQYVFPASELLASGLCPGLITKISFYAVGGEAACTPFVNCPDIRVDIRMGNTALANFGPTVASQLTPLTVDWDAATEASGQIYTANASPMLITGGWVDFQLAGAGFNWTGGNMIIDVSWIRAAPIGNSPPVQLEEGLAYTATKWVQVLAGINPSHGSTYTDNPLTVNASTGTTNNRPVTRFYGKVSTPGFGAATTDAFINYGGGLIIDSAASPLSWAETPNIYRGPGSIRARVAVYDGNTQLSDHVFDKYYDGDVAPEDVQSASGYAYVGLPALKDYLQKERHLPNMPSREDWEAHGSRSLGELQTGLWETVETQALHISELESDLSVLEVMAFGKPADPAELEKLIADVNNSRRLTDQQKLHLTDAIRSRMNAHKDTK